MNSTGKAAILTQGGDVPGELPEVGFAGHRDAGVAAGAVDDHHIEGVVILGREGREAAR